MYICINIFNDSVFMVSIRDFLMSGDQISVSAKLRGTGADFARKGAHLVPSVSLAVCLRSIGKSLNWFDPRTQNRI